MAYHAVQGFRLQNARFTDAYIKSKKIWDELARDALAYVKKGNPEPRADDIAPILALTLEDDKTFRKVMSDKKQRAKYWYRYFADYVIDQLWGGPIKS